MPDGAPIVDELDPTAAWKLLAASRSCALVDVRTRAEWASVGVPDLAAIGREPWFIEWQTFPSMALNPAFVAELVARMEGEERPPERLFFICRSGVRSRAAAQVAAAAFAERDEAVRCTNVAEGFEGELDAFGRRGTRSGWKARGLPWRQG